MTKSRLILLDANVVIHLFEMGIWQQVVARCKIVLAQTVVDEAQFYEQNGERVYIERDNTTADGAVVIESASPADVQAYCDRFDPTYYEKLDPGEAESLTLLDRDSESQICSADKIVWRVLGNINATERGVSLEEILQMSGLTKPLPRRFTKAFRKEWCKKGSLERLLGRGDKTRPF